MQDHLKYTEYTTDINDYKHRAYRNEGSAIKNEQILAAVFGKMSLN